MEESQASNPVYALYEGDLFNVSTKYLQHSDRGTLETRLKSVVSPPGRNPNWISNRYVLYKTLYSK